jgi:hypothetical protein
LHNKSYEKKRQQQQDLQPHRSLPRNHRHPTTADCSGDLRTSTEDELTMAEESYDVAHVFHSRVTVARIEEGSWVVS